MEKTPLQNVMEFVEAGNAVFTIEHEATGKRFTYKVRKPKPRFPDEEVTVKFVSVLTGSNNDCYLDYSYMGILTDDHKFIRTAKAKISESAMSMVAFRWFWKNINNLPDGVNVYHEGRCGRCGRRLTVPESIMQGFGPECIGLV